MGVGHYVAGHSGADTHAAGGGRINEAGVVNGQEVHMRQIERLQRRMRLICDLHLHSKERCARIKFYQRFGNVIGCKRNGVVKAPAQPQVFARCRCPPQPMLPDRERWAIRRGRRRVVGARATHPRNARSAAKSRQRWQGKAHWPSAPSPWSASPNCAHPLVQTRYVAPEKAESPVRRGRCAGAHSANARCKAENGRAAASRITIGTSPREKCSG